MSSSRHPVALTIEQWVSSSTRLLALVMVLPLVDGVFAALVLAGALGTVGGIVEVGLLVFGGSAMVAVVLAEMDQSPREQARTVLGIGVVLVAGAAVQAALAPTIASVLEMAIFERFAGVVILAVAANTASSQVGEYLPGPGVIVALGLVASLSPSEFALAVQTDPGLILRAVVAASVGVVFALAVALASPWLRNAVDVDRFRFGSAVALGVLALSTIGVVPTNAPVALSVLGLTTLLAFDPGQARERDRHYRPDEIDSTTALPGGDTSAREPVEQPAGDVGADDEAVAERDGGIRGRPPWF